MDYVNILPNIFAAAFLIAVFVYLKKDCKKQAVWGIVLCVLLGACSILTEIWLVDYTGGINHYTPASFAMGVKHAMTLYPKIMVSSWVEAIWGMAAFALCLYVLRRVILSHITAFAGRLYRTEDQAVSELARLEKGIQKRIRFTAAVGAIALLLGGAYSSIAPWASEIWILNGLAVGLFTYGMYKVYAYINENLYLRILRNH